MIAHVNSFGPAHEFTGNGKDMNTFLFVTVHVTVDAPTGLFLLWREPARAMGSMTVMLQRTWVCGRLNCSISFASRV